MSCLLSEVKLLGVWEMQKKPELQLLTVFFFFFFFNSKAGGRKEKPASSA